MFGKAVVMAACAAVSAPGQDTSAKVLAVSRPGMADVRVLSGQVYKDGYTMDVYRAASQAAGSRRPALIFVHGGLVAGVKGAPPTMWPNYQAWGRLAAASGWVGVMFNHGLTTNDNVAAAEGEVRLAIKYARDNADRFGIDAERLCIAFFSAGGAVAAAALHEPDRSTRCVVLFYPFLDLEHMRTRTRFRDAVPPSHVDPLVARYSPAAVVAAEAAKQPPIYVAMAGQDAIPRLNESIMRFMQAAMAAKVRVDFALHPTGVHGFDQSNHDERSREILEDVLAFVGRHLARQ